MIGQRRWVWGAALVALTGCGTPQPPVELQNARVALVRAKEGPSAQLDPADLHQAEQTLRRAEASFEEDGATRHTKDLAYTAERQVMIAQARARTIAAERAKRATLERIDASRAAALARTRDDLSQSEEQLELAQARRKAEAERRTEAERRAKQVADDLAKVASVKQDARGTVVTLSGAVLFASDKAKLLPAAERRLADVARALARSDDDSTIVVEGYTDSRGTEPYNQELSRERAESVRDFLVTHGVAADRVRAEGHGESRPIADNDSPEGRANNRRVEIVVQHASAPSPTTPRGGADVAPGTRTNRNTGARDPWDPPPVAPPRP